MALGGVPSLAIIYPFSFCLISLTPGSQERAQLGTGGGGMKKKIKEKKYN